MLQSNELEGNCYCYYLSRKMVLPQLIAISILTCHSKKSTVLYKLLEGSVTVSQHAQYQDPETTAAKWNAASINCIIYTCGFPTVTCQKCLL